jgi:hypothetical protein
MLQAGRDEARVEFLPAVSLTVKLTSKVLVRSEQTCRSLWGVVKVKASSDLVATRAVVVWVAVPLQPSKASEVAFSCTVN